MKRNITQLLLMLVVVTIGAQEVTLTVSNPIDRQRQEVVEVSATQQQWQLAVDEYLCNLSNPIKTEIK